MGTARPHPQAPALKGIASPIRLSATPARVRWPPPRLGEHTDDVLAEAGVDAAERRRLHAAGVVSGPGRA
jgi:crotonobetainyl-CoA:carnitine CoA-transferase CaiB-like acyl-CoA transferase